MLTGEVRTGGREYLLRWFHLFPFFLKFSFISIFSPPKFCLKIKNKSSVCWAGEETLRVFYSFVLWVQFFEDPTGTWRYNLDYNVRLVWSALQVLSREKNATWIWIGHIQHNVGCLEPCVGTRLHRCCWVIGWCHISGRLSETEQVKIPPLRPRLKHQMPVIDGV